MIRQVFEYYTPCGFNRPVTHYRASKLEVGYFEPDVLSVCKFDVIWSSQPALEGVCPHRGCEFIKAPVFVGHVLGVQVEVGYWRVVGGVLAKDLSAITELSLEGLSEDGIERLILAGTDIDAAQGECYN